MLKTAISAALLILPLSACATATRAVDEGARGVKLAAIEAKDAAFGLKDKTLDAKDWGADYLDLPTDYHGRGQAVCGYLAYQDTDHNIYPDAASLEDGSKGFGVMPGAADHRDLQKFNGKYVCVTGEVFYRGCSKELTCTSSDFPHAVRVDDVRG